MKESKNLQLPEYQFIRERTLRIISLHSRPFWEGISIERIVHSVAQTMPPEYGKHLRERRRYVRQIVSDLKASGEIYLDGDVAAVPEDWVPSFKELARWGDTEALKSRLEGGGISDEEKNEAMISAVINNEFEAIKLLIEAGADVNAKDQLFKKTAMMYVTKRTRPEIIKLLIDSGAKELPS